MRLDYLGAKAIHGGRVVDFELMQVSRVSVVIAPNDAGKSTLLDLVRLLVSPRPSEPYFDHPGFQVHGEWTDGCTIRRSAGTAGGKQDVEIDGKPVPTKAANARIVERFGRASTFSLDGLAKLTAAKRTEFLDQLIPPTPNVNGGHRAEFAGTVRIDLSAFDGNADAAVAAWDAFEAVEAAGADDTGPLWCERQLRRAAGVYLDAVVSFLVAAESSAKAALDRAAKAAAADHVPTLIAERAKLRAERDRLVTETGRAEGANDAALRLRKAVDAAPNPRSVPPNVLDVLEDLENAGLSVYGLQIEGLDQELAALDDRISEADWSNGAGAAVAGVGAELGMVRATLTGAKSIQAENRGRLAVAVAKALAPLVEVSDRITQPSAGLRLRAVAESAETRFVAFDGRGLPLELDELNRSRQAVAAAGLHIAVVNYLGGWRVALLDRLEEIGAERRTLFLTALREAVDAGLIDNVLAACVADGWTPPAGVDVIELEVP